MDRQIVASKMGQHSDTKPGNKADAKLSIRHLRERIKFNAGHTHEHLHLMMNGGTRKYNKDHIKHHEKQVKEDQKLIKDRQKLLK